MRPQFQSPQTQFTWHPRSMTNAIKVLITINVILYLFQIIAMAKLDMISIFGLSAHNIWPFIWQPFTYMFMHGGLWHIAINMFVLWMFGTELESIWGKTNFLKYYFVTGVGAGIIWLLFNISGSNSVLIGASGAVYGILMAYGLMFPNRTIHLYFLFPIKVKWFVLFVGVLAFVSSMNANSNISHLTHLSGMLIGYLYLRFNENWRTLSFGVRKKIIELKIMRKGKNANRSLKFQQDVDKIIDKANIRGWNSLSKEEQLILHKSSRKLFSQKQKD